MNHTKLPDSTVNTMLGLHLKYSRQLDRLVSERAALLSPNTPRKPTEAQTLLEDNESQRAELKQKHVRNLLIAFQGEHGIPLSYPWDSHHPRDTPDSNLTNVILGWIETELGGKSITQYGHHHLINRLAFNNNGHSVNKQQLTLHQFLRTSQPRKLQFSSHEQLKSLSSALTAFEQDSFKPTPELQLIINRCSPYNDKPRLIPTRATSTGLSKARTIRECDGDVIIRFDTPDNAQAFAQHYQLPARKNTP